MSAPHSTSRSRALERYFAAGLEQHPARVDDVEDPGLPELERSLQGAGRLLGARKDVRLLAFGDRARPAARRDRVRESRGQGAALRVRAARLRGCRCLGPLHAARLPVPERQLDREPPADRLAVELARVESSDRERPGPSNAAPPRPPRCAAAARARAARTRGCFARSLANSADVHGRRAPQGAPRGGSAPRARPRAARARRRGSREPPRARSGRARARARPVGPRPGDPRRPPPCAARAASAPRPAARSPRASRPRTAA